MGSSYLVLLLAVFVVFLGILGGLAVAVTKTVNPDGRVTRGFFGSLASAVTLIFLCCTALLGTGLFVATLAIGTAIDKNPIRHIEIRREQPAVIDDGNFGIQASRGFGGSDESTVHVLFSVEGDGGGTLLAFLEDVVGVDRRDLERVLTVTHHVTSNGERIDVYEFELPISADEIADLEHEIRHELDGVRVHLPDSVAITFAGAERL